MSSTLFFHTKREETQSSKRTWILFKPFWFIQDKASVDLPDIGLRRHSSYSGIPVALGKARLDL
jgi:hypothetical protein